jgi:hypothetical protein
MKHAFKRNERGSGEGAQRPVDRAGANSRRGSRSCMNRAAALGWRHRPDLCRLKPSRTGPRAGHPLRHPVFVYTEFDRTRMATQRLLAEVFSTRSVTSCLRFEYSYLRLLHRPVGQSWCGCEKQVAVAEPVTQLEYAERDGTGEHEYAQAAGPVLLQRMHQSAPSDGPGRAVGRYFDAHDRARPSSTPDQLRLPSRGLWRSRSFGKVNAGWVRQCEYRRPRGLRWQAGHGEYVDRPRWSCLDLSRTDRARDLFSARSLRTSSDLIIPILPDDLSLFPI